jgi:hypothetical protein
MNLPVHYRLHEGLEGEAEGVQDEIRDMRGFIW